MEKTCTVTIFGKNEQWPAGASFAEIVGDRKAPDGNPVLLVKANGRLRELHKTVREDCRVEALTIMDTIGMDSYRRSLVLLFLRAAADVYGMETAVRINLLFSISNGYWFILPGGMKPEEKDVDALRARMRELVAEKLPIRKRAYSTPDALAIFRAAGMDDKVSLFRYRRVSRVNIYNLDGFRDYFYGYMLQDTGYLQYFDLSIYEGGIVLEIPDRKSPEKLRGFTPQPKLFGIQMDAEALGSRLGVPNVGSLNDRICSGGMQHTMMVTEALQESRIAAIAEEISSREAVKCVLIAGPSSSGKTTFSRRLSIQLTAHGRTPHPISLDNYYKNRVDCPRDENGQYDFECLEALDLELLHEQLIALTEGKTVELPRFNFTTGEREYRGDMLTLGEGDILVLEGIHGLSAELSSCLPADSKYRIYISALTVLNIDEHNYVSTTDGRLLRRIVRDHRTRATSAQETIAMWPSVRRGENNYIFPNQENADVIFNSSLIYELSVLKVYAEPLLFQIPEDAPEYQEAKKLLKFLDYFLAVPSEDVPHNSILREFIGGSIFDV